MRVLERRSPTGRLGIGTIGRAMHVNPRAAEIEPADDGAE